MSGLTLLQGVTATDDATVDLAAWYSSSYEVYVIELINLLPVTDQVNLMMRVSTDGGSNWDAGGSNYRWTDYYWLAASSGVLYDGSDAFISIGSSLQLASATYGGICGELILTNPGSASLSKHVMGQINTYYNQLQIRTINSNYIPTGAINGIRFVFSSGNVASGTVRIYGLAK